jgi:hypothetical protein
MAQALELTAQLSIEPSQLIEGPCIDLLGGAHT